MPLFPVFMDGLTAGAIYALCATGFTAAFRGLGFSRVKHGLLISFTALAGFLAARMLRMPFLEALGIAASVGAALGLAAGSLHPPKTGAEDRPTRAYYFTPLTAGSILACLVAFAYRTGSYSWPSFFPIVTLKLGGHLLGVLDLSSCVVALALLPLAALAVSWIKRIRHGPRLAAQTALAVAGLLGAAGGFLTGLSYPLHPQLDLVLVKGFLAANLAGQGGLFRSAAAAIVLGLAEALLAAYIGAWASPAGLLLAALVLAVRHLTKAPRTTQTIRWNEERF